MTKNEYIKKIERSTSVAEIQSLARRAGRDEDVDLFDNFMLGMATQQRLSTPVCEL